MGKGYGWVWLRVKDGVWLGSGKRLGFGLTHVRHLDFVWLMGKVRVYFVSRNAEPT